MSGGSSRLPSCTRLNVRGAYHYDKRLERKMNLMRTKHLARTVTLLCIIVATLLSESGAIGSVPPVAHAAAVNPVLNVTQLQPAPLSVDIVGNGFTPSGSVHIDFLPYDSYSHDDYSLDLIASRTITFSVRHTMFILQGGHFETTMTVPYTNTSVMRYSVVATDSATNTSRTYCSDAMACFHYAR